MANKKYNEFTAGTPADTDILLYGNPSTGDLKKVTVFNLHGNSYSLDEQICKGVKDIDGKQIYWRTWYFEVGNGAEEVMAGLLPSEVSRVVKLDSVKLEFPSGNIKQVETHIIKDTGLDQFRTSYLYAQDSEVYITVWYTKV